jgi:hypothetical protein
MGGAVAAERRERHFGVALDEQAYGWSDLSSFPDPPGMTRRTRRTRWDRTGKWARP